MKPILPLTLALLVTASAHAAAPTPTDPVAQKRAELLALNERIETRLDDAVGALSGVGDSADSRLIVSHVKGDAIKGLRTNLEALRSKREMLRDQALRYGGGAADELQAEVARIDQRIAKRIDQMIRIAASLDTPKEVDRYRTSFDGWNITQRESEAWQQNQISTTFARGERKEIVTGLQQAITRLEAESRKIRGMISPARTPRQNELLEADAERIDGLLAQRREQLKHALSASGPRRALDQEGANELRKLYTKLTADLSADTRSLMRKYSDYVTAVTAAAR